MLDITSGSSFNIKSIQALMANLTDTEPQSVGGSNSSILVFEYQYSAGQCRNHTTIAPFFELISSNSHYKRLAEDKTVSRRSVRDEISFFTSGISYEMEWDEPLSYTLFGINPSFFAREFGHNSIEPFSVLFDKLSDDHLIRSLICAIKKVAINPNLVDDPIFYINTQANALVVHFLSYFGIKDTNTKDLSTHSLKKINNWLNSKIEMNETIEYDEIIEILNMERVSEFIRLFENSIGISFYRYCLEKQNQIYINKYASLDKELSRKRILKILEIIAERVKSDYHNLDDFNKELVNKLGVSEHQITKSLRLWGKTPKQIYYQQCLEKAKYLLITTSESEPIEKITNLCGFNDTISFSKAFTKKVGLCPKKFRQKYGQKKIYIDLQT